MLDSHPSNKSISGLLKLNWHFLTHHYDVVHNQGLYAIAKYILTLHTPMVTTIHSMGHQNDSVPKADIIACISKAVYDEFVASGRPNVVRVDNGINVSQIRTKTEYDRPEGTPFRIVQVGRLLAETKGQDLLIKAVKRLEQSGVHDVVVDFIGDGPSEGELKRMVQDLGLTERSTSSATSRASISTNIWLITTFSSSPAVMRALVSL